MRVPVVKSLLALRVNALTPRTGRSGCSAILLAADDAITDPTIRNQIRIGH